MLRIAFFDVLIFVSSGYALLRGGAPERIVGAALPIAYGATLLSYAELSVRFDRVETGVLVVDAVLLVILTMVALRADRAWPILLAGLQLATVGAHLVKLDDVGVTRVAYALAMAVWSYPMLFALAWGTRRHRLRLRANGADQDWSA